MPPARRATTTTPPQYPNPISRVVELDIFHLGRAPVAVAQQPVACKLQGSVVGEGNASAEPRQRIGRQPRRLPRIDPKVVEWESSNQSCLSCCIIL